MTTTPTPPRPRKHLMAPGQPPRQTQYATSIGTIQKWVLSTLAVSTIMHLAAGLVLAAAYVDKHSSKIGLLVISGAFGLVAAATGLLIHQKGLRHPFMLVGLLPPLVGAFLVL